MGGTQRLPRCFCTPETLPRYVEKSEHGEKITRGALNPPPQTKMSFSMHVQRMHLPLEAAEVGSGGCKRASCRFREETPGVPNPEDGGMQNGGGGDHSCISRCSSPRTMTKVVGGRKE